MDLENTDSLQAADEVNPGEQTPGTGSVHMDLIAQAEQELAAQDTAAPTPGTPGGDPAPKGTPDSPGKAAPAAADPSPQQQARARMEKMIASWPEQDKQLFASAPENLRELLGKYYHSFQKDHTQKTQQAAALRAELEETLAPLRPVVTGKFRDMQELAQYITNAQRFEEDLQQDPVRAMALLAQRMGVDLAAVANYQPNAAYEAIRPLREQVARLQQTLERQSTPAAPAVNTPDGRLEMLRDFAAETDEQGALKHPYFEEVAAMMGLIMRRDGHEDLERAYQEALYSHPQAREKLLEAQRADAVKRQAEVDKAKRAAALQRKATSAATAAVGHGKKKIEDIIAQAEQSLSGQ